MASFLRRLNIDNIPAAANNNEDSAFTPSSNNNDSFIRNIMRDNIENYIGGSTAANTYNDMYTPDKLTKKGTPSASLLRRLDGYSRPTNGEWTQILNYDPGNEEATIKFQSGFVATYPNITPAKASAMMRGATTKDGRKQSVGAWLHRHPEVMHNYY